jgi:hypothetical protein
LGYPHELWTTRLLAAHARHHGPLAGHLSLAKLAQGTVCKILAEPDVKPHKVRYHPEKRDPELDPKPSLGKSFGTPLGSSDGTRRRSPIAIVAMSIWQSTGTRSPRSAPRRAGRSH